MRHVAIASPEIVIDSNIRKIKTRIQYIMAAEVESASSELFLDDLMLDATGTIVVMLCRMWDVNAISGRYLSTDFLVSDAKGNVIHCTAKGMVAHNFLRLKEGGVYSVKNFVVMHNKEDFRIRKNDTFMLEFDGSTTIRKVVVKPEGFVRYPFQLVDFDHLKPTANKYLIDVAGYVTNVGRMSHTKTGSKNLDFYLANHRGQSIRVTLWGSLGDILIEKKPKHVGLFPVVVTSTSAKHYNNKVYLSSSSSTLILDDVEIPAIKELKSDPGVESSKAASRIENSEPREGTIENLLIWARNRKNDSTTFICKAKVDNVRTRKGWNFPSCGGEKCKKCATRKDGRFWCDACERPIEYPVIRYRLELGISDDTEQTVVVLFDEPATKLVKFPAAAILEEEDKTLEDHANLPPAISNLIGTTHVFEIKTHTYYEYGTFESFTCWTVEPPHPSAESASSSTIDDGIVAAGTSSIPQTKAPSAATPSKSAEYKKKKRAEIEDSDAENELIPADDGQGEANTPIDNKKTRRFVVEDSD